MSNNRKSNWSVGMNSFAQEAFGNIINYVCLHLGQNGKIEVEFGALGSVNQKRSLRWL
jgi:hypothetical protein